MRLSHLAAPCALATALWACATAHETPPPGEGAQDSGTQGADEADAGVIQVVDAAPIADAAGATDAAVDAAPELPACETSAQLLDNGAFDHGPGVWIESSGGYDQDGNPTAYPMVRDLPVGNDTGSHGAWLGGYIPPRGVTATDTLVQELVIPTEVSGLRLTGRAYIESNEFFSGADDTLAVELLDEQDQLIETLGTLSNLDETHAWASFQAEPGADLAGRRVRLRFRGRFDADQITNFYVDTVALTVTACR